MTFIKIPNGGASIYGITEQIGDGFQSGDSVCFSIKVGKRRKLRKGRLFLSVGRCETCGTYMQVKIKRGDKRNGLIIIWERLLFLRIFFCNRKPRVSGFSFRLSCVHMGTTFTLLTIMCSYAHVELACKKKT